MVNENQRSAGLRITNCSPGRSVFGRIKIVILLSILVLLSACGGGSSSSGGGTTTADIAGTYTGGFSLFGSPVTAPTLVTTETGSVVVVISDRARLTITLSNGGVIIGTLSTDNRFSVSDIAQIASGDQSCSAGTITLSGSVVNGVVAGNFSSSSLVCAGLAITLSGTFRATRS